jgi:hypothetical protein
MNTSKIEYVELSTLIKANLMKDMADAMFSAIGTFVAIKKGFLQTGEKNGITGETLEEIAIEHEKELRELFNEYNKICNNL